MGLAKGGKDRTLLVLAEQPDERGVLPQLERRASRRGAARPAEWSERPAGSRRHDRSQIAKNAGEMRAPGEFAAVLRSHPASTHLPPPRRRARPAAARTRSPRVAWPRWRSSRPSAGFTSQGPGDSRHRARVVGPGAVHSDEVAGG